VILKKGPEAKDKGRPGKIMEKGMTAVKKPNNYCIGSFPCSNR